MHGTRKSLWIGAAVAGALTATAPSGRAAEPVSQSADRTLTVTGEGEVKAVPDEAILSAGVVTEAASAAKALAANRREMNDVFAALKQLGIADKSVQTSEFNISPQYDTGKDGSAPPRLSGYQVNNTVSVTIDDLSKLGRAIDAFVASGANSMGGINFTIRDPKPLLKQAREAAIKDATDRAETYADAAGVSLGNVLAIDEGEPQAPQPFFRPLMALSAAPPTPIAAGEQTVTARVTMKFAIK